MAITQSFSGSSSISTTEFSLVNGSTTLAADGTDGALQGFIDFNAMAAGDTYEIKIYEKARAGDTQRLLSSSVVTGAQAYPLWVMPAIIVMHGWDVTVKKLAGTDRTINWSLRTVA